LRGGGVLIIPFSEKIQETNIISLIQSKLSLEKGDKLAKNTVGDCTVIFFVFVSSGIVAPSQ
jgi:hypothetical protein